MLLVVTFALAVAVVAEGFWFRVLAVVVLTAGSWFLPRPAPGWLPGLFRGVAIRSKNLAKELRVALERGEIDIQYRPIVDLPQRRVVGAEVLPRWRHPRLGWVDTTELLWIATGVGLEGELSASVLRRSCRQLGGWLAEDRDLWLSVRIPQSVAADGAYAVETAGILAGHGIPPGRLVIEIGDPWDSWDARAGAQLSGLRTMGVKVALGGFEPGHDSMRELRSLSFDLVAGSSAAMAAVGFGRRLGFDVLIQGLRDEAGVAAARAAGCRYGQGDFLGCPAPAERFEALLDYAPVPLAGGGHVFRTPQ